MVRKKYRRINAKNFVAICDMPLMETRADVIEWMKNSEFIHFVYWKSRSHGAIVLKEIAPGICKWQGANFDEKNDVWNPEEVRNGWQLNINEALAKDEIDLMPPLYNKLPNKRYDSSKSEVIKFLKTKQYIFNLLFTTACWNDYLQMTKDGKWIGSNNYRADSDGISDDESKI